MQRNIDSLVIDVAVPSFFAFRGGGGWIASLCVIFWSKLALCCLVSKCCWYTIDCISTQGGSQVFDGRRKIPEVNRQSPCSFVWQVVAGVYSWIEFLNRAKNIREGCEDISTVSRTVVSSPVWCRLIVLSTWSQSLIIIAVPWLKAFLQVNEI